jgi:hypothetical protein
VSLATNIPTEINEKLWGIFRKYFANVSFEKVKLLEKILNEKEIRKLDSNDLVASKSYVSQTLFIS